MQLCWQQTSPPGSAVARPCLLCHLQGKDGKETYLWKKYSIIFKPIFEASVLTVVYTKKETAIRAEEPTMAYFRPIRGTP